MGVLKSDLLDLVDSNFSLEDGEGKFYVYGLFYDEEICFYIGKGRGKRCDYHFRESNLNPDNCYNEYKVNKILKLRREDYQPRSEILVNNLNEERAFEIEEFLIGEVGLENLTNLIPGGGVPFSGSDHPLYNKKRSFEDLEKISTIENNAVKEIRWLSENSVMSESEIAEEYDILRCTVQDLKKRRTRSYITAMKEPDWYNEKYKKNILLEREKDRTDYSIDVIKEIKWLVKNTSTTYDLIKEKYGVDYSLLSDVKNGNRFLYLDEVRPEWIDEDYLEFVEAENKRYMKGERNPSTELSNDEVREVKWLIDNTSLTLNIIADRYGVFHTTISAIKNERSRSYISSAKRPNWYFEKEENELINNKKRNRNGSELSKKDVMEINWFLEETDKTQRDISNEYDVSESQISNIKNDKSRSCINGTLNPNKKYYEE